MAEQHCLFTFCHQVMFIQNKGHVTMTIELLDTEEAQADDPLDVQVNTHLQTVRDTDTNTLK